MTDDISTLFEAAVRGDLPTLRFLAARQAPLDALDSEGVTALCRAAEAGQAHVVDWLLDAGANAHVSGGPGKWAYQSARGIQWDVLSVTRADPSLATLWSAAGLPFERRDNYTMTEPRRFTAPAQSIGVFNVIASRPPAQISHAVLDVLDHRGGLGPTVGIYTGFCVRISSRFEEDQLCTATIGARTPDASTGVPSIACASVLVKGPLTQLGFAHYALRHWLSTAGIADPARELREVYHYYEGAASDANVTEIQLALEG
ncbi:MAG: ankyrin repeat domain-containing protein [Capsulimonadaceae bacterium]|nr:ankyrin repeat domain-containing protein [Capsulimonadaceae bacterium]